MLPHYTDYSANAAPCAQSFHNTLSSSFQINYCNDKHRDSTAHIHLPTQSQQPGQFTSLHLRGFLYGIFYKILHGMGQAWSSMSTSEKKSAFKGLQKTNSLDILGLHLIQTTIAENSFSFFFQYPPNINF